MAMGDNTKQAQHWESVYRQTPLTELPWEEGKPSEELVALVESGAVEKGPALDICCGSGNNAIYLAGKGFTCYGIDISPTAIGYAREKAAKEGAVCSLMAGNALDLPYPDDTFTLIFDRGCFHSQAPGDRVTFVKGVYRVLRPGGKYYLHCFSTKDHPTTGVPYSFSPKDIRRYFPPPFKIRYIRESSRPVHGGRHYFLSVLMEKAPTNPD